MRNRPQRHCRAVQDTGMRRIVRDRCDGQLNLVDCQYGVVGVGDVVRESGRVVMNRD